MPTHSFTNNLVLWVDDRPDNNVRERALMTDLGLVVQIVVSTGQALQYLRRRRYGAIISDMARQHQGSREGYVLLQQVRAEGIRTPYFIYAGSAQPELVHRMLQAGGNGCTNEALTLLRMVTLACCKRTTRTGIGLMAGVGEELGTDVRRELDANGVEVDVTRDPRREATFTDPVQAWVVAGGAIAQLAPLLETLVAPVVFLPCHDWQAAQALNMARPQDEVCGVEEAPWMQAQRVLRCLRLREAARLDSLTGLLHRRAFEADFLRAQGQSLESMQVRAIFLLDIDHLKTINDRVGHAAADGVLQQLAERLRSLPGAQSLARIGGEEFAWLARAQDLNGLSKLAERAVEFVNARPFQAEADPALRVTASVGWTLVVPDEVFNDALGRADQALYHAKGQGRDCAVAHHHMAEGPSTSDADIELLHFQNVAKVVMERSTRLVSLVGKDMIERARRLADRDPLTGAWNRGYLDRRLSRELELARRDGRPLALALMDLDHFGQFNKRHGTPTGDAVLRKFVRVAEDSLRATDWLARYGGEEFVLVVPGSAEEAAAVAERLRSALAETDVHRPAVGGTVRVTVSIGIAAFDASTMPLADALFQCASEALQSAKQQGRDRIVVAG